MDDGTIYPHYIQAQSASSSVYDSDAFSNSSLRVGEVTEAYFPDDPRNKTAAPKQIQYRVRCAHRDGTGQLVTDDYVATVASPFGGVGDKVRYTLRTLQEGVGLGSRVLLLCINGTKANAVIISGIHNVEKGHPDGAADVGHHYEWEFNGVNGKVDKDGQLYITVPGATKADGLAREDRVASNKGTAIRLLKDGTVQIDNNQGELVEIDSTNRKINFKSKNETHSTEESWTLTATKDVTIQATKGHIDMNATSAFARLNGSKVFIGSIGCTENIVLGRQLQLALADLVATVFLQNAPTWGQFAGAPVQMNPKVLAAITTWASKWVLPPLPPILSLNKFTE